VVVAHADQERDRLAGGLQGGGELAGLALEFGRLVGAVGEDDRAIDPLQMPLGGELLLHLVGELDVGRALRQPHRLEVVHAGGEQRPLHHVVRHPEFLPVGDQHHAAEMGA